MSFQESPAAPAHLHGVFVADEAEVPPQFEKEGLQVLEQGLLEVPRAPAFLGGEPSHHPINRTIPVRRLAELEGHSLFRLLPEVIEKSLATSYVWAPLGGQPEIHRQVKRKRQNFTKLGVNSSGINPGPPHHGINLFPKQGFQVDAFQRCLGVAESPHPMIVFQIKGPAANEDHHPRCLPRLGKQFLE